MEQVLKVDFENVLCNNFLGMGGTYHAFSLRDELDKFGDKELSFKHELERLKATGMKIVRVGIGPGLCCARIGEDYDMHSKKMDAYVGFCKGLQEIGVDIAICIGGTGHGVSDLDNAAELAFTHFPDWLCKTLFYLLDECKLTNIKYMLLGTEYTTVDDHWTPKGYDTPLDFYIPMCKAIHKGLCDSGLRDRVKLVGPNNSERGRHLKECVEQLNDVIDIYSGHFYNYVHHWEWKSMCDDFTDIVAPTGKPVWFDEYGIQLETLRNVPQYGTMLASIICASVSAGHQYSFIWSLFDQKFPNSTHHNIDSFHDGVHRWGVHHWDYDNCEDAGKPYPSWYAFKLLSQALRGENVSSVKTEDRFTTWRNATYYTCFAAATKTDTDCTIIAVNTDACPQNIVIDSNGGDKTLYRYTFEPWSDDEAYETEKFTQIEMKDGKIYDTLGKGAFCIYTTKKVF